jgi:aminoglycoside N3'-acetyltransferase
MDILERLDEMIEIYEDEVMICEIKYKRLKRARSTKKAQRKVQNSGTKAKLLRSRAKSMRKRKAIIPNAQSFPKELEKGVK